jgi:hypothetical protein
MADHAYAFTDQKNYPMATMVMRRPGRVTSYINSAGVLRWRRSTSEMCFTGMYNTPPAAKLCSTPCSND